MDTGKGVLHIGVYWGEWGRTAGRGSWGGIAWGEMPNVGEGQEGSKTHCHVCTYATILHVLHMYPQNLKFKKKEKKKEKCKLKPH